MAKTVHYATSTEDLIPFTQKFAYAIGMFVNNLQAAAMPAMVVILNLGLGMDPLWVGIIGFVPRIFDAVSDPIMGYVSDNTKSRWGRRRPYIFVGALLAGIVFAAMWQLPPGHSQGFYFWTFLSASILYFLTYTLYATPFVAIGYEMTPDYHERTRLHAFANTVGQLAWLGVPWFYAIMASEQLFDNLVHGARVLALWVGGALCVLGLVPAIFCRERVALLPRTRDVAQRPETQRPETQRPETQRPETQRPETAARFWSRTVGFFPGFMSALQCRPFVKLCAATFLVFNGFQVGMSFTLYVLIYYVFVGEQGKAAALNGWFGTLSSVFTLCVIPLTGWIATRLGKRETFLVTISISLIGYAMKWVGYDPEHPNWLLASCPFLAFGIGSLFTLMGSMIADACDYDELQNHQRREGLFGAIYWWMVKIGMALAGLLTGVLLNASGFDVAGVSSQSEQTSLLLRVFDVGVPLVTSALAIWIIATYEITETRAHEIRAELERRRGKPHS